ncbi:MULTISPECIES: sulfite exporter TauE/SafE family protein [Ramlibacter]|uniref:Probable membrane transporter protein n=1 Tax=Ramlibacter pinisoli TaxID=2682844 RepID=A0A6N8IXR5_9BURK|nr:MULTISPECIES: sulfite exporter TauE/SafE family protein [Ramlibacter]MBA2961859.1 sulfite exporter TauE/SafE family protein [Ramlibacter sp. CGMCC 1.13660]MVQ31801.1 TSUP family transporter [Ramlibacter pinisoli]
MVAGLDPALILELLSLGVVAGFLAGLLGIGGGLVLVPCLTLLLAGMHIGVDVAVKVAIATSMAVVLFTSASSALAHHRRGSVRWTTVARLAPGIVIGSIASSLGAFTYARGAVLALLFAALVLVSSVHMVVERPAAAQRQLPGAAGQAGAGAAIGFVSGLAGAGGGFVSVPWMTWYGVPMRNAVATSAALGVPIAAVNVVGYVASGAHAAGLPPGSAGYVWVPAWLAVAAASIAMAPLGARAAHAVPAPGLRKLFSALLMVLSVSMAYKALAD